jgi:hypothetical protein
LDFFRTGFTAARNASINGGGFGAGFFAFGDFFLIFPFFASATIVTRTAL